MNTPVNERVNARGMSNLHPAENSGKPTLVATHGRELLNLRRLPAMLTLAQTAVLLNRGEHDIPVLVREGLLTPLGDPPPNAVKYFATVDVLEVAEDREMLGRICAVLTEYWRGKNALRSSGRNLGKRK
jgi:hypothetical protein